MAIARRKAGTVVRCPKCAGEIIVPTPEGMPPAEQGPEPGGDLGFDDPNFDVMMEGSTRPAPTVKASTEAAPKPMRQSPTESSPSILLPHRRGLFLSLGMLIVVVSVVVLLLILVFVLGLIIGRSMRIRGPAAALNPAAMVSV
jgi:hypothetical protein